MVQLCETFIQWLLSGAGSRPTDSNRELDSVLPIPWLVAFNRYVEKDSSLDQSDQT